MEVHKYWRGVHRHIKFEVWNREETPTSIPGGYWAGYIILYPEQIDMDLKFEIKEFLSGTQYVDYAIHDNPILLAVDDVVHGGVTFTEIVQQRDLSSNQWLKIGWDYSHYNSGWTNELRVEADCKAAIDALWEFNPDIKVHCSTVGGYHDLSDGVITTKGEFISNTGIQWRKEQGWSLDICKPTVFNHFCFHPTVRPNSTTDYCDVFIYSIGNPNSNVVVICQPQGYQGMSVTNAAEYIITELLQQGHAKWSDIFVEHYPIGTTMKNEESIDLVEITSGSPQEPRVHKVQWRPYSRDQLETLIGQKFEGVS